MERPVKGRLTFPPGPEGLRATKGQMPRITPISYRSLARLFERDGWQYSRQKGDHLIYTKPGNIRPLVIPMYDEVPVFIIKNLLRTAGMSRERYLELIAEL